MIPSSKFPSSKLFAYGVAAVVVATSSLPTLAQGRGGQSTAPRSGAAMSAGSSTAAPAALPEYRIGVEDVLDIRVMTHADLDMVGIQVRPDGRISMPLVNDIQAAGLTPMELRLAIIKALRPHWEDQEVSVTIRDARSQKFFVIGSVKASGKFDLRSQTTVLEAIAIAGGLVPDFSDASKIYVVHADGSRVSFNYKKFMSDPASEVNFLLKPGDIVVVPER
jgi:polysaccharide export outer membrane protein